ncbi:MAG: dienelactone hydrolase family protein [Raineya sp.]|jgi:carboxymethylenebutenolidase|nr:dienelactone hydrolase family protein [Raineya sp.]
MKKIFLSIAMVLFSTILYAQTCCQVPSATTSFADLADEQAFRMSHDLPLPYKHISDIGKDITFKAADGTEAYGYELKVTKPSKKYIFVIHEWWGLNDHIKREAEKIYNDLGDVNVIALDLYDKKVATSREEAAQYMQAVKAERAQTIIKGAFTYAGKGAKIGTIGWCFGGGWSLQTALLAGKQAKACVIYYGMPEKDVEKLKTLKAEVLGIFASKEKWINSEIVAEFEKNLIKLKKKASINSFNAEHAFANPSNPNYDKDATEKAYQLTIAFFRNKLK